MLSALASIIRWRVLRRLLLYFVLAAGFEALTLMLMLPLLRAWLAGEALWGWVSLIVIMASATFALSVWGHFAATRVSVFEVCDGMMQKVSERALSLPLGWFDAQRRAQLLTIMSREVNTLSHVTSILIPNLVNAFVVPAWLCVGLWFLDWRLALVPLLMVPLLLGVWRLLRQREAQTTMREITAATKVAGRVIEFAKLQMVLRAYGWARRGWPTLQSALQEEHSAMQQNMQAKTQPVWLYALVIDFTLMLLLVCALWLAHTGVLDLAGFLAVAVIAVRIAAPLSSSVLYGSEWHKAELALNSVQEILNTPVLPQSALPVTTVSGHDIVFEDVDFAYNTQRPVLKKLCFTAPAGKITALVGASGTGKSTLLRLVARFWDVNQGCVRIGGVDVRDYAPQVLMQHIAMVFQEVYLFDTTIKDNILLANPNVSEAEFLQAVKRSRLEPVIARLPEGWNTRVGPAGVRLSGGERQRVAIARAFIKDAPILLLDEMTSALDSANEAELAAVIQDLARHRTVMVVAHRLKTIEHADQVIVLAADAHGQASTIVQQGKPSELATQSGAFADFIAASQHQVSWH